MCLLQTSKSHRRETRKRQIAGGRVGQRFLGGTRGPVGGRAAATFHVGRFLHDVEGGNGERVLQEELSEFLEFYREERRLVLLSKCVTELVYSEVTDGSSEISH